MAEKRMRIGFITQAAYQNFQSEMLSGVTEAASKHDADIIRFSLSVNIDYFPDDEMLDKLLRTTCKIADQLDLDGLLLLSWIAPPETVKKYISKNIPFVILGSKHPEHVSVYQDGCIYIKELVDHLVEEHGRKKIVYIEPTVKDSRIDCFTGQIKKHGLYIPEYILTNEEIGFKPYFGFHDRADRIVSSIYDEKKLDPDAIMIMHSNDAVGVIDNLISRGIRVPEDVSVTSWEEGDLCRYNNPPVTTVYFPFEEIGYNGCDILARILKGENIQKKENTVPSRIIKRKSCGCGYLMAGRKALPSGPTSKNNIINLLKDNMILLNADNALEIFDQAVAKNESGHFISWIREYIKNHFISTEHIQLIQEDILTFRQIVEDSQIRTYETCKIINDIWINTLLLLSNKIESILGKKERYKLQYTSKAERISLYLNTMFDMDKIRTVLSTYLPKIKINKCIIYGFTIDDRDKIESDLIYNFPEGRDHLDKKDRLGDVLFHEKERQTYVVHLLRVNDAIIGCVFFDYAIKDDRLYLTLATQLSSAIHGARNLEILKHSVEEKEMLMKELQHRVKNNLVTIISLLNIQSDKIKDTATRQIFEDAENKIRSMSLIYERLYQPSSNLTDIKLDEYLLSLASQLLGYFDFSTNRVSLTTDMDKITLDMKRCVYLGLLTNEIITNSFKYAFPEKGGNIHMKLKEQNDNILLEFTDNGIGIGDNYEPDSTDHFGLNLVRINVNQLNGELEIGNIENGGTKVSITFPL